MDRDCILATEAYLREIILNGGAEMGRSQRMPTWRGELSDEQVGMVIAYLLTLRMTK